MTENKEDEFTEMQENSESVNRSAESLQTGTKKKAGKAKTTSLVAQIIAALWVAVWCGLKFYRQDGETADIIFSGFAIAACFSPVYFSMVLDKIKNIKFGE